MAPQTELLKGTLDLLILKTLEIEPRHGLLVAQRIEQLTRGAFSVKPGSLFQALHRMEENKGRAKYYKLTNAGRRQLEAETKRWGRIALAITQTLESS